MWDYSKKVVDHFLHPRNVGEIEGADAIGEAGSMACGDLLLISLKLDDKKEKIVDAKFKTFGCASAIASASALTEMLKGKTIEEAKKLTNKDIAKYLGGLPDEKMHCSVLGREALDAALESMETGTKKVKKLEGKIVCKCFGVTENEIIKAIEDNKLKTVDDVTHYTKAGGACKSCHEDIKKILEEKTGVSKEEIESVPAMTMLEKVRKIDELMERSIRPALQQDGGDIELVDVCGQEVMVKLKGACKSCPSSHKTMRMFVEKEIKKHVSPYLRVRQV